MKQGFRRTAAAMMTLALISSVMSFPAAAYGSAPEYFNANWTLKAATLSSSAGTADCVVIKDYPRSSYYMYNMPYNIKIADYYKDQGNKTQNYPLTNQLYAYNKVYDSNAKKNEYISFMNNLAAVYQYYQSMGFSYAGSNTEITLNGVTTGSRNDTTIYASFAHSGENQADATSDYGMMVFGGGHNYLSPLYLDKECVAHEFGHLVTEQLCGWHGNQMSAHIDVGALAEAYSDIFAELMSDTPDWKVGAGAYKNNASKRYCFRNIASPSATCQITAGGADIYRNYHAQYVDWMREAGATTSYAASTVFSHAAYLMYQGGIPAYDLRNIWYQSLTKYPEVQYIDHMSCRRAVLEAATEYLSGRYRSSKVVQYLGIIREAFDEVGINSRSSVTQNTANNSTNMNDFMRAMSYRYPTGNYWTTGDVNRSTSIRPANNYDRSTYMPEGVSVGLNYMHTNWEFDGEPFLQCAGFAKKLQVEYFGTGLFTQLDDQQSYVPKMGDHIRLALTRSPIVGHSIFVKSISGNTISYAECVGADYSRISLTKTGTFSYDSRSKQYTFTLDGSNYDFVWAQRPIPVGDLNADSVVDSTDQNLLYDLVYNNRTTATFRNRVYQKFAADINDDGSVNSTDIQLLSDMIRYPSVRYSYGYID